MTAVRFIGHDASRTGAPQVLLQLLEWAGPERLADSELWIGRDGPLRPRLSELIDTRVLDGPTREMASAVGAAAGSRGRRTVERLAFAAAVAAPLRPPGRRRRPAVTVANTLAALPFVPHRHTGRLICHVHELDGVAERVVGDHDARERRLAGIDHYVAAGPAVEEMLVHRWSVPVAKVTVVDEFVTPVAADRAGNAAIRASVGCGPDRALVVAVGALGQRKGADAFVDLLADLRDHPTRPYGVWVGGDHTGAARQQFEHDVAAAGLEDSVTVVSTVDDPRPFYAAADVVVSTAREDPYPLTALEAGVAGTAFVAVDSGGITSALRSAGLGDCVVAGGDTLALGERIASLLDDPVERGRVAGRWSGWVSTTHLVEHLAPRLWDVVVGQAP